MFPLFIQFLNGWSHTPAGIQIVETFRFIFCGEKKNIFFCSDCNREIVMKAKNLHSIERIDRIKNNESKNQPTNQQTNKKSFVPSNGLMKCLMWNCIQVVTAINLLNADNEKKKEFLSIWNRHHRLRDPLTADTRQRDICFIMKSQIRSDNWLTILNRHVTIVSKNHC